MDRFARVVLGYHGCTKQYADSLISGETTIDKWKPSQNAYDWLGHGIYFWEHAPERARAWGKGGVVGAVIQLGVCLDFTDIKYTALLKSQYVSLAETYKNVGQAMPKNRGADIKLRDLDCLVINDLVATAKLAKVDFQTVRCPFWEGEPAFPGSEILEESHIQIAVIDSNCILGVFRPNLS